MVDVVRCDRQSGQAVPMAPRPLCIEPGCPRPAIKRDRCGTHYNRWRVSPDFEYASPAPYIPPPDPECPWCGPYQPSPGASSAICPTCGLDAAEVRYAERIIADSAAVLRQEYAEYRATRRKGGP